MSSQFNLFKTKRFLPLFITQFFGAFNDNAFKNAFLIWFTYDIAEKQNIDAGLFVAVAAGLFILPFFLFSALAGQCADKFEKSKIVRVIKLVEIILMSICFIGFYTQNSYFLLIILFLMGVHSAFFGPLKYSLLPLHLKNDELISGNGFVEAGTFIAILLGTIIGGLLIRTHYGIEIVCFIVALCAIIGYLSSRHIPQAQPEDARLKLDFNIFSQTLKIINYSREEKTVFLSIVGISWFWLIGITFLTGFPLYAKNIVHGDEKIVTLFLSIFSIGIAIGSVICNKLLKGEINGRPVPRGSMGITISIISFFIFGSLYQNSHNSGEFVTLTEFLFGNFYGFLITLSLLSLSICSGIYIVPLYAIMQHRSNKKYLARIISANNVMNALFMVLASIITAIFFTLKFKIDQILLIVGLANIIIYFIVKKIVERRLGKNA